MNIGILCPSEIAYRRFLPALQKIVNAKFIGVGVNSIEERYDKNFPNKQEIELMLQTENDKAKKMVSEYGGQLFNSYESIINCSEIEAIYIPLPPALHYKWAKFALETGKHVLVEKPSTISFRDTSDLVNIARGKGLALHENYMFVFHQQIDVVENVINNGEIGDIRLIRISFGFPRRSVNDFRYNKTLGGGALLDAGGYTIKYATKLLGETAEIKCANLNYIDEFDVDMYGSATIINRDGVTAQIAFGMDNDYRCELEVWGSKGTLRTGRILTAPAGFSPTMTIKKNTEIEERILPEDDAFKKSIEFFNTCIFNKDTREKNYDIILKQAQLVDQFSEIVKRNMSNHTDKKI